MKTNVINKVFSLFLLMLGGVAIYGQGNQAEVPGDHFSLEGALELFKKSASPEEFEQLLNSEDSKVNNLDLNGDGYIDYIRVIDRNDGNVHAFILQAVISEKESQDVAVIELEKLANGKAVLQITGDEDVYGVETIIEPTTEVRTYAGTTTTRTVVNVWAWPSVQYIYSPYYTSVWVSPWRWSVRPVWYRAWRPVDYYVYSPYWYSYRPYYTSCHTHRVYAQHIYQPYRTTSVIVYNRHHTQIDHYRTTNRSHQHYSGREYSGRDRNDYNHSGRQGNNSHHDDANGRTRSTTYTHNENSRSTDMNRSSYQKKSEPTRDSQRNASDFSSGHKFSSDARNMPTTTKRQSDGQSRRDYSNRKSSVSDFNRSSHQQISTPKVNTNTSRPSSSLQSNRSSSQVNRTHSSGSLNHQRTGNGNGGGKSGGHSRAKH